MNLISAEKISKTVPSKILFQELSLGVNEGDKLALIGVNGCGKSTLLKILAGEEVPDSGVVSRNRQAGIGYLPQVPLYEPEDRILDHILKSPDPKISLIKTYEGCTARLKEDPQNLALQKELENLLHEMEVRQAWEIEREFRTILDQLGITDLTKPMSSLSGGMLKKVALARCLVSDFQLLILDEPTNHLDLSTIQWLESYLAKNVKSLVMVTHDRYFLDRVCNRILELDHQKLYSYLGNYRYYLEKKAELENQRFQESDRIRSILRTELVWLARGPQARGTKQKARIDRIDQMRGKEKISESDSLELAVAGRRLGNKILELKQVSKSFGPQVILSDFSYTFKRNEILGIIGPNGAGKSTLLQIITGKLAADGGEVDLGQNTVFGFFDQNAVHLKNSSRVIDFIREAGEQITLANGETLSAGKMLERFLFPASQQSAFIESLSGGERRRLYLLHILMKNPNFLIFDEPTNDLDIQTLSILEDFLLNFGGCVLVVSHDRYFMDRVAGMLLVFEGDGKITSFPGNYSEYLQSLPPQETQKPEKAKAPVKKIETLEKKEKTRLTFAEKQELARLEKEIETLEAEKGQLEARFNAGEYETAWTLRHEELEKILPEKMERWAYLADFEN